MGNKLEILVQAEVQKAVQELSKVDKTIGDMRNTSTQTGSSFSSMQKAFMGTVAKFTAGIAAIYGVASAIKNITQAYAELEQAEMLLDNAISRNPLLDEGSSARLKTFASEIQNITTVSDDAAIKLMSLGANTGRTEGEIREMMRAAADLSAALGISLDQAMQGLNQSFEGGIGALGRYLPELRNMTEEQLRSGDAIDFVRENFDGAAEAMATTTLGSFEQLSNATSDLREEMGQMTAEGIQPLVRHITSFVNRVADAVGETNTLRDVLNSLGDETDTPTQGIDDLRTALVLLEAQEQRVRTQEERSRVEGSEEQSEHLDEIMTNISAVRMQIEELERLEKQQRINSEYRSDTNEYEEELQRVLGLQLEHRELINDLQGSLSDEAFSQLSAEQQQVEIWKAKLDQAVAVREELQEQDAWTGDIAEHYQNIISKVAEQLSLKREIRDTSLETTDELEDEEETEAIINDYLSEKLKLEGEIARIRALMENSGGAEFEFHERNLIALQDELVLLTRTNEERRRMNDILSDMSFQTEDNVNETSKWEKQLKKIEEAYAKIQKRAEEFRGVLNAVSGVYDAWNGYADSQMQKYRNSMQEQIKIANETQKEQMRYLSAQHSAKNSLLDEDLRNGIITQQEYLDKHMALEKEKFDREEEIKREKEELEEELLKEQNKRAKKKFQIEKSISIANTTISGAEAFVKALTAGPILGPILATTIAGLTTAQLGLISATEFVPQLDQGGVAVGRTFAEIGEGGEPEMVLPLSKAKDLGFGGGSVNNYNISVNAVAGSNKETIASWIVEGIRSGQQRGLIGALK